MPLRHFSASVVQLVARDMNVWGTAASEAPVKGEAEKFTIPVERDAVGYIEDIGEVLASVACKKCAGVGFDSAGLRP